MLAIADNDVAAYPGFLLWSMQRRSRERSLRRGRASELRKAKDDAKLIEPADGEPTTELPPGAEPQRVKTPVRQRHPKKGRESTPKKK